MEMFIPVASAAGVEIQDRLGPWQFNATATISSLAFRALVAVTWSSRRMVSKCYSQRNTKLLALGETSYNEGLMHDSISGSLSSQSIAVKTTGLENWTSTHSS